MNVDRLLWLCCCILGSSVFEHVPWLMTETLHNELQSLP